MKCMHQKEKERAELLGQESVTFDFCNRFCVRVKILPITAASLWYLKWKAYL